MTVSRLVLLGLSLVLLLVAVQLSQWFARTKSEPQPEFQALSGRLAQYWVDTSGKSKRTTLFAIEGASGRFWTQALSHDDVLARWKPGHTELGFHVQTNRTYLPMHGDAVKTFGLLENGREIQGLEQKLEDESAQMTIIRGLSYVMYGLALALALYAVSLRGSRPSEA